jgi:hypothetical protein
MTSASNQRRIEMRTRCKFRVVGVEDTEGSIYQKVYASDTEPEAYAAITSPEYEDTYANDPKRKGTKYKSVQTGKYQQNVRLAASYDTANPEDVSFAEATPSGELKIFVSNPVVVGSFKPGQNYYLDLIPCDK